MVHYESYLGRVFAGRYTLVSLIGTGESSAVFGAVDCVTAKTVALKMLSPERLGDTDAVRRFQDEINVLSLFDHPNIVKLLDVPSDGENRFFVMEYIEGITLKKHILSRGALDTEEILFLSRQILSALGEVHDKGVVHSDIKPQNIVIVGSGDIKLMDFGIAKTFQNQGTEMPGVAVGTVQYVSPEQAEGKPLDHLSDIYSFGVMLYEMATGVLPFIDVNPGRIAAMHVDTAPIPPSMICAQVTPELEKIILRTMEKSPEARYPSAAALLEALEGMKKPQPQTKPSPDADKPAWHEGAGEIIRRLHFPSLFAGVLTALLITVVAGLSILTACLAAQERDGTYLKIPDLVGKSYALCAPEGSDGETRLVVEFVTDSAHAGQILAQSPAAGSIIKKGSAPCEITLRVAYLPLPTLMPDLSYLPEEEALTRLEGYACRVETVYEAHNYLPRGIVIRTEPRAGERTTGTIRLIISQ